jgi:hypothetical protein
MRLSSNRVFPAFNQGSKPAPAASSVTPLTAGQHALLAWLLVTLWLIPLAGCQGCWSSTPPGGKKLTAEEELEEKEKKKKKLAEKPKPDFEIQPTIVLPNESGQDAEDDGTEKKPTAPKVVFFTKPGHWIAGAQLAKANNFDFQGELRTFPMDQSENPLDVEHTDFRLSLTAPASLPKGVQKRFETMFYLPKRGTQLSKSYTLRTELRATRSTRLPEIVNVAGNSLREHEYYLVVLARNPSSYVDLAKLDSIELQMGSDLAFSGSPYELQQTRRFYHPVFPRTEKGVPLPSHPLAWTMIAYIVWDDLDPNLLTERQKTALIDWIHWGGQLIVSGPNSLDRLKESFLEPYLPAASGKALQIDSEMLQELNEKWSLKSKIQPPRKPENIVVLKDKPLVGVELLAHPEAEWLPDTGNLVLERQVGNGRIVVSAFSLSAAPYRFWASRDNFFNACLLRRPGRDFYSPGLGELHMTWVGKSSWARDDDPRLATRLRYFTRDIGKLHEVVVNTPAPPPPVPGYTPEFDPLTGQPIIRPQPPPPTAERRAAIAVEQQRDRRFAGYQKDQLAGMAGWNDFSGAAEAALAALDDASGIKIPRADFVLKVLLVYLIVLVPLNWFIFRMMGRVEYAWLAAPIIAIVGAMAVIRLAQLDIGFARSRTEIAVLESHAGYPRAHVTRYAALYTSLSTSYDLRFTDPDALALPLALNESYNRDALMVVAKDVNLTQNETIELSDVQVRSNSTGRVHIEQMLSLAAPFRVTGDDTRGWQLENGSQFKLRQAGILRRIEREEDVAVITKERVGPGEANDSDVFEENGVLYKKVRRIERKTIDRVESAYFPDIPAGGTVRLDFQPVGKAEENSCWVPQWDNSPMMSSVAPAEEENRVRLHRLSQLAAQQLYLQVGEMRLIAWTDAEIPGLKITPSSTQSLTYTLVLVHLKNAALPPPQGDVKLRTDVLQDEVKSEDEKAVGGN